MTLQNRILDALNDRTCLISSLFLYFCLLTSFSCSAQDTIRPQPSSWHTFPVGSTGFKIYPYNKARVTFVKTANVVTYGGLLIALNSAWYSGYPKSKFHFFDDNAEWLQVDKAGHAYSAYLESRANSEMWRWTGISDKKRIWIGGLSGVAYQAIIETLDGFSSEYGFSIGDFTANAFGSALFISQELAWDVQKIQLRFSFHKNNYQGTDLNQRADRIFGKTEIERLIKDYNAQTYWLTADLHSFLPHSKIPRWLCISVGYGAEGLFGARNNIEHDKNGLITFNRSDIPRYRQWFLSPDIDLSKVKTNKKVIRFLLNVACAFKFPMPTLELSQGSFKGHWLYF